MRLLLIHGAGASPLCWKAFNRHTKLECYEFSYDVHDDFSQIVENCIRTIDGPTVLVGHSFGGIVAWHSAIHPDVIAGISIASPWGGSNYADFVDHASLGLLPTHFFKNVGRRSHHLVLPRTEPARVPWMNVITTRGTINKIEPNDGVVTTRSQSSLFVSPNTLTINLEHSHNEVLLSEPLAEMVDSFSARVAKGFREKPVSFEPGETRNF